MGNELSDYKERYIRWQGISLTQLGYTNNILLSLTIGFLAIAFDKDYLNTLSFSKDSFFNLKMCFYFLTILFLLLSIVYGVLTSLSRLYDFKITQQIVLTRQRFYDEYKNQPKALPNYNFQRPKFKLRFKTLCFVLFHPINYIDKKEIKNFLNNEQSLKNFNKLRRIANTLGVLTWRLLKFQFLFLVISMLFYSINLFI